MKKFTFLFALVSISIFLLSGCLTKELTPEEKENIAKAKAQLPFNVELDGNNAVSNSTIAALIEEPVSTDAEIVCDIQNDDIINITFFPCNNEGIVVPGKKPALIIIREGNKTTLSQTIDGKELSSGFYLMDVSAGNKTSRIVIEVE